MTPNGAPLFGWAAFTTAAVFIGACILFLTFALAVAVNRARKRLAQAEASAEVRPLLHCALVELVAGGSDETVLRSYLGTHPTDLADSILLFQGTVGGSARDRLCKLALDFGLVAHWCEDARSHEVMRRRMAVSRLTFAGVYEPSRRLAGEVLLGALRDTDEEVRLSACRGLLQTGGEPQVERVFDFALGQGLLARILLSEDLRRFAQSLGAGPAHQALKSGDPRVVRAALELLVAWERAIPLDELRELLESRDPEIRALAFRLAAFVTVNFESRLALIRALQDADIRVRELAIIAIGRQKMTEAIAELALCLRREGVELARYAAEALAAMPPLGWRALEEFAAGTNPVIAVAAREALARARKGA